MESTDNNINNVLIASILAFCGIILFILGGERTIILINSISLLILVAIFSFAVYGFIQSRKAKGKIDGNWYKTWWGFLLLITIVWPAVITFWILKKKSWSRNTKVVLLAVIWIILLLGTHTNENLRHTINTTQKIAQQNTIKLSPTVNPIKTALTHKPTATPTSPPITTSPSSTPSPTKIPEPSPTPDTYTIFSSIGRDVHSESSVSVTKNRDGSVDVINIIEISPEVTWGLDAATRKWVTEFMEKVYTSEEDVRYALVSVTYLHTGMSPVRVGLGNDKAKLVDWDNYTPYDFCNWLHGLHIGDDNNYGFDDTVDPSGWAFATNWECD